MRVGIPKGLLYCKYHPFFRTFFQNLGAEVIESEETNQEIMNLGVKVCVDEACLPVKVYHGHVATLKDQCDLLVIPRIMGIYKQEYICPKFCGLPEMVAHSIPGLPEITKCLYTCIIRKKCIVVPCNRPENHPSKEKSEMPFSMPSGHNAILRPAF